MNNNPLDPSLASLDLDLSKGCLRVAGQGDKVEHKYIYFLTNLSTWVNIYNENNRDTLFFNTDFDIAFTGKHIQLSSDRMIHHYNDEDWRLVWRDVAINWHKRVGRCITTNRLLSLEEFDQMAKECHDDLLPYLEASKTLVGTGKTGYEEGGILRAFGKNPR